MPRYLKTGISEDAKANADAKVRRAVEDILAAIEARGDTAVREYSQRLVIAPCCTSRRSSRPSTCSPPSGPRCP